MSIETQEVEQPLRVGPAMVSSVCEFHTDKEKDAFNTCPVCLLHIHKRACEERDNLRAVLERFPGFDASCKNGDPWIEAAIKLMNWSGGVNAGNREQTLIRWGKRLNCGSLLRMRRNRCRCHDSGKEQMKKTTAIVILTIWTAIWIAFGITSLTELNHWGELSSHLKSRLVMFILFVPLAWVSGVLKLLLIIRNEKIK